MKAFSRREFLKMLGAGAAATFFLSGRSVFSLPASFSPDQARPFQLLVVGDSLIAGQGLKEKDRFYFLVKRWLEQEALGGKRPVNLKMKAHSGSRIFLHENEKKALGEAEKDLEEFYHPEVNFSFPDIKTQIDLAAREYQKEGIKPENIDLIMVSGGITNLNTSYIANPFEKNSELREKINKYCDDWMFRLLKHTGELFPKALTAVIGYYPFVSKYSATGKIYNAILELYKLPGFTKPLMNNLLTKQFFKPLHHKMNRRSRIWRTESDRAFQRAVEKFNQTNGERGSRAVFVSSPIDERTCFGTRDTLLWGVGKKGRTEDEFYDVRRVECKKAIESVRDVKLKFKRRFCELSAIGHPNVDGSKAYARAVIGLIESVGSVGSVESVGSG